MQEPKKPSGYLELIKIPAFSVFWSGRIISEFGDILFTMATMWYVLSTTDSALATAIVPLVPMLAFLTLSLPLSTVADRFPKKFILIGADVFRGIVVLLVFLLMMFYQIHPIEVYIANLLLSVGGMLFGPAEQSALPGILKDRKRQLSLANGLLIATKRFGTLFGYGLGGLIVAWLGTANAIFLDGVTFFLSALSFMFITIPSIRSEAGKGFSGFLQDSLKGIRFIWGKPSLRVLIIFGAAVNMVGAPMEIFTSVFSKEVLHAGLVGYGYMEASAAAGIFVAALISGKWAGRLQLWQWMLVSFLAGGVSLIVMALFPSLWLAVVLFGISMAANALLNIPLITALQLLAPDDMRGRIMTSFGLFFSVSAPIGLVVGGWLTSVLGPQSFFTIVGILIAALGITSFFIKGLREEIGRENDFHHSVSK